MKVSVSTFHEVRLSRKVQQETTKQGAILFQEIASLSLNSYLHLWDAETFKQVGATNIETICFALHNCGSRRVDDLAHVPFDFLQKLHRRLNCPRENVCMTINAEKSLYAVGSQSHVTFVDSRSMKNTNCISSLQRGSGEQHEFPFLILAHKWLDFHNSKAWCRPAWGVNFFQD